LGQQRAAALGLALLLVVLVAALPLQRQAGLVAVLQQLLALALPMLALGRAQQAQAVG
jgi:hypothetical protein